MAEVVKSAWAVTGFILGAGWMLGTGRAICGIDDPGCPTAPWWTDAAVVVLNTAGVGALFAVVAVALLRGPW